MTKTHLARAVRAWRDAERVRHEALLTDAAREFEAPMRVGFGIEDDAARDADFAAVRGEPARNATLRALGASRDAVESRALRLLARLG